MIEFVAIESNVRLEKIESLLFSNGFGVNFCNTLQYLDGSIQFELDCSNKDLVLFYEFSKPFDQHIPNILRLIELIKRKNRFVGLLAPFMPFLREHENKNASHSLTILKDIPIFTLDAHSKFPQIAPITSLSNKRLFDKFINADEILIFPDCGATRYKGLFENEYICGIKDRINGIYFSDIAKVQNRVCCIFDDLIDTGQTMKMTTQCLKEAGAKSVKAFATHTLRECKRCKFEYNEARKDTYANTGKKKMCEDFREWGLDFFYVSDTLEQKCFFSEVIDYTSGIDLKEAFDAN